jgi:hypothetical protein
MQLQSRDYFSGTNSSLTIVEISQKIQELLDQMEYSNNEMLLTKEHIKYNLNQLITSANNKNELECAKKEDNYIFAHNFLVDKRGKIKANFS